MAGLLEGSLVICVCKLGLSVAGVRAARGGSLSSVGLCCSLLLLFTDLAITLFLAFILLADSWQVVFPVSGDIITLRFLLFLTHTYGDVILLTVPLMAVEMAFLLRWPHLGGTDAEGPEGRGAQTRGDECCVPLCSEPRKAESGEASHERAKERGEHTFSAASLAHSACVLSCLLAWCISGLRAERRWAQHMPTVEVCVERYAAGGGRGRSTGLSLWRCLPSLLCVAWADLSEPCWGFLAALLLLGHYACLRLISLRPDCEQGCPERAKSSLGEGKEIPHNMCPHGKTATPGMALERDQDHMSNAGVRVHMQTQASLCTTVKPSGGVWTQSLTVDTETTAVKSHVFDTGTPRRDERHQALRPHGKCCPSSPGLMSVPDRCRSVAEAERPIRQMQGKQPPASRLHALREDKGRAQNECSAWTWPQSDCAGVWVDPQEQLLCLRCCSQRWAFPGRSPSRLIAALVWGIFVCLFPVLLGFSVLVIQHTETLVFFGLKVLWKIQFHDKHTESTGTEFMGS